MARCHRSWHGDVEVSAIARRTLVWLERCLFELVDLSGHQGCSVPRHHHRHTLHREYVLDFHVAEANPKVPVLAPDRVDLTTAVELVDEREGDRESTVHLDPVEDHLQLIGARHPYGIVADEVNVRGLMATRHVVRAGR